MTQHFTFYIDKIKTIEVCNFKLTQFTGSTLEWPTEIIPTEGEHNYLDCHYCLKTHKQIYDSVEKQFRKFPFCCDFHSKIVKTDWYDKSKFGNLPKMVADKVIFTNQHILNHINNANWYDEIYNYIEYATESFGSLPYEYGMPIYLDYYYKYVAELVKNINDIEKSKKNKLFSLIYLFSKPSKEVNKDYFQLLRTYKKWVNLFPFSLPFFSDIQEQYLNTLPTLHHSEIKTNPYTHKQKAFLLSDQELIESLIDKTKNLLQDVKHNIKNQSPTISEVNKAAILILGETARLEQESLLSEFCKNEKRYLSILRRWLIIQRKYFDSLKIYVSEDSFSLVQTKREILKKALSEKGFFQLAKVKKIPINNQDILFNLIADNKIPYQIAMFDFIGFIEHLRTQHYRSMESTIKWLTKTLNEGKNSRKIKGNINVLSELSKDKKDEFHSYLEKERVIKDYQILNRGN